MSTGMQPTPRNALFPGLMEATVFDVMHAGVTSCSPQTTVRDAARAMTERGVHAIVIENLDADLHTGPSRPWRLFSSMDLVRAARGGALTETVGPLASEEAVTLAPDAPLAQACEAMAEHDVPHLVVLHAGRPVGILSSADVARALAWATG